MASKTARKAAPTPKQARAQSTIDLLINEADKAMKNGGEGAVRIQEISETTKVSIGSIYHHFGDRDGLVRATYMRNLRQAVTQEVARVRKFMERMNSAKELSEHYSEMLAYLSEYFQKYSVVSRANIIGSATARPLLRDALIEVQTELIDSLTEVMQLLKDRQMLKPHLDARAAAVVLLGMLHGRIIAELDATPVEIELWNKTMLTAFSGFFKDVETLPVWERLK
jgi:AcrR family transcriptional regulator